MTQNAKRQAPAASRKQVVIAGLAITAVGCHLVMRYAVGVASAVFGLQLFDIPLVLALALGGTPLVLGLLVKLSRREFGSDLLAGISIVTSVLIIPHQYLAGTLVVLMLSGGEALEAYAVRSASSVLAALAKRMPSAAHRKRDGQIADVPLDAVAVGDALVVFPHEICPVDGAVVEGHGAMDESYLTGEPYRMSKAPGSAVLSGAVNGDKALTIRCEKPAADSRYAKIMQVMRDSEQRRPRLRRLGDQLGAWYTPLAVAIALAAWAASGDPTRFLAVLVVATPCPLLIAIPVAIIGSVSLSARRGDHHQGPGRAGKGRRLPHRHLRQDRHAHLRPAPPDGLAPGRGLGGARGAGAGRRPGALLEAPAGRGGPGRRREAGGGAARGRRGERAAGAGADRRRVRPIRPGHEPEEVPRGALRRRRQAAGRRRRAGVRRSSSTAAMPRRCGSATSRGRTAPPSFDTSAAVTASIG